MCELSYNIAEKRKLYRLHFLVMRFGWLAKRGNPERGLSTGYKLRLPLAKCLPRIYNVVLVLEALELPLSARVNPVLCLLLATFFPLYFSVSRTQEKLLQQQQFATRSIIARNNGVSVICEWFANQACDKCEWSSLYFNLVG